MNRKLFILSGVILPWALVIIFGLLGLETKYHFFQVNEVIIKTVLLSVVLLSCAINIILSIKESSSAGSKIFKVSSFVGIFLVTFFSMWFILSLRNGINL